MIFKNLIQANLRTEYLGKDIEYYQIIDSTNKEAKSIINNNEATHIEVENNGVISIIEVEKVILAGGSLNTPSILLNSGYKNPQLGRNLKNHPVSGVAGLIFQQRGQCHSASGSMLAYWFDIFPECPIAKSIAVD